jgi:Asp-tRNA(Asn)/Glu-tRNA(Gln) amidotransferase A subunit family amidase
MKAESRTPLGMRPYDRARAVFPTGRDAPNDYLERCLATIAELEPQVGAFVHLNEAGAREAAGRSAARWSIFDPLSLIDGMPVGIKDIIETIDMPTEMGSPLYAGWQSGRDAATVAALRDAGAIILGKTVTTEFAATHPAGTKNPWDLNRTPGGSSSGSAAAVAAGMLPAALGTQVVGSIIRPASYCGCYGFKPSLGAINRGGSHDGLSQSCHGALAASLEDAWNLCWAIATRVGGDPGYPGLAGPEVMPAAKPPRTLALLETPGWKLASDEAKQVLSTALGRIREADVIVIDRQSNTIVADVETALEAALLLSRRINAFESRWPLNTYRAKNRDGLSRTMLERLAEAEAMTLDDYRADLTRRARIRELYAQLGGLTDGVITLSATGAAPLGLQSTGDPIFAVPGSLLGVPAISLPVLRAENLPLGLQVLGFEQQDAALFHVAVWLRELFEDSLPRGVK